MTMFACWSTSHLFYDYYYFFVLAGVCCPLLCSCRPFVVFEGSLTSRRATNLAIHPPCKWFFIQILIYAYISTLVGHKELFLPKMIVNLRKTFNVFLRARLH
jgi:hypothetical protein